MEAIVIRPAEREEARSADPAQIEGLHVALITTMLCGRPVVATDVGPGGSHRRRRNRLLGRGANGRLCEVRPSRDFWLGKEMQGKLGQQPRRGYVTSSLRTLLAFLQIKAPHSPDKAGILSALATFIG